MNRRLGGLALCLGLVLAAGCTVQVPGAWQPSRGARIPELIADESVGGDLRAVANKSWSRFLAVFEARTGCFGDVHLTATRHLADRAAYEPGTATATVRVPASAAMLQSALVHEWAHHVEFQCDAQRALRPAFLAAQGLPADRPWRQDDAPASRPRTAWADSPSEQYAEAVVALVLGRRQIPTTARVRAEAVRVVRDWASGR